MLSSPFVKSLVLALTFALIGTGTAQAAKRSRPERRASLVWLLASYHTELKRETLDELGPDTVELLIDIANTPRDAPRVRVRALAGPGLFPSEGSYSFPPSLLNERNPIGNSPGVQIRPEALRPRGRGFCEGPGAGPRAGQNDEQTGVRQAVAQALGDSRSARALPVLELWLTTEQDLLVRDAVDRAVNQLRGR